ncbi:MAG: serine/threonine-protein kinase [Planctomycetota bacterium]
MLDEERTLDQTTHLGAYEILGRIGQGGMGAVYRARHTNLGVEVAVKVLSPRFATDPGFIARFKREAKAAAALSHPNIVRVSDAGEDRGLHYIVMEFVDGTTLAEVLSREGRLPVVRALEIVRQIADALVHAEERKIVHRDITPGNIMLTREGVVKLADLGLAKQVGSELATGATETGATIGTPYYMSPEQVVDSKNVDHRSDIYSLGATLYHLVSGKRPFDGGSAYEIMRRVETDEPAPLAKLDPKLPKTLCNLVARMMAKNPDDRYGNARALLADIDRISAGKSIARFRAKMRGIMPAGEARKHWKGALVAGLSAALVSGALVVGFLVRFLRENSVEEEPSVVTVPTRHWEGIIEARPSGTEPDATALWKTTLPTELPVIEKKDGRYTLSARRSKLVAGPSELSAALEGVNLVAGDIFILGGAAGAKTPAADLALRDSPTQKLIEGTYQLPASTGSGVRAVRVINFRERELLIAWELDLPDGATHLEVGVELASGFLEKEGLAIDGSPSPVSLSSGQNILPVRDAFAALMRNRTINFVIDAPGGVGTRLELTGDPSKGFAGRLVSAQDELHGGHYRIQLLITSVPAIRQQAYTAYLANGRLELLVGDQPFLLSDSFDAADFSAARIMPTDYYRSEEGDLVYYFATPAGREGSLVKYFNFRPGRIETQWWWKPPTPGAARAEISYLLAPDAVLGRDYIATAAGGEEVKGKFSAKTMLENVRDVKLSLGTRSVALTPANSSGNVKNLFDGARIRLVILPDPASEETQSGGLGIVFSNSP